MQHHLDPAKLSASTAERDWGLASTSIDFDQMLAAVRRQAQVIGLAAASTLALAIVYIAAAVPQYTATCSLIIDSQKDKSGLSASIAELTFDAGAIDSQVEVLRSERIALAVVASQKLTEDPEFAGATRSLIGRMRALLRVGDWLMNRASAGVEANAAVERAAVTRLKENLDVKRVARTYVLAISYTSADRAKAARIANAFADAYVNDNLDAKLEATRRAATWLQSRLSALKQQSLDSDLAIQRFKAAQGIVVTGGDRPGLISDQQMTQLNEQIVTARADTARAEARYAQIQELLRSGRVGATVPDSLASPVVNELRAKFLSASKLEAELEAKLGGAHIQVRELKREMQEFNRLIYEELQRTAESYRSEAEVDRAKEQSLTRSMSSLVGQSAITNETMVQLRELEREADAYRSLYQTFMQRYQDALQQQSFPVTEARVITAATTPETQSFPKRGLILALSLVLGLMAGGAIGALREYRDRVFRTTAHVRDETGLAFLGLLQSIAPRKDPIVVPPAGDEPGAIQSSRPIQRYAVDHPLSHFSEMLRATKVAVDFATIDQRTKIVGIISALPDEGKSTVAKNLSSLLAHIGATTLLVDADLRNPGLTRSLARHALSGLLEALRQEQPLDEYLLLEPDSGLWFLPAVIKKRVLHSSEVIASGAMRTLLMDAAARFDYVIVDLPPLAAVVDVHAASSHFDAFVLIVEWGRTPRILVQSLLAADEILREKCVGVLYNKVDLKRMTLYESYDVRDYRYGWYGEERQKETV